MISPGCTCLIHTSPDIGPTISTLLSDLPLLSGFPQHTVFLLSLSKSVVEETLEFFFRVVVQLYLDSHTVLNTAKCVLILCDVYCTWHKIVRAAGHRWNSVVSEKAWISQLSYFSAGSVTPLHLRFCHKHFNWCFNVHYIFFRVVCVSTLLPRPLTPPISTCVVLLQHVLSASSCSIALQNDLVVATATFIVMMLPL